MKKDPITPEEQERANKQFDAALRGRKPTPKHQALKNRVGMEIKRKKV